MKKIEMPTGETKNFSEAFEMFVISQTAKGVADITIRNYHSHMNNISHYLDTKKPFDEVTRRDIEAMIVAMRKAGISHNSIATYNRMLKTFYNRCKKKNLSTMTIDTIKEKETVKETYTDYLCGVFIRTLRSFICLTAGYIILRFLSVDKTYVLSVKIVT